MGHHGYMGARPARGWGRTGARPFLCNAVRARARPPDRRDLPLHHQASPCSALPLPCPSCPSLCACLPTCTRPALGGFFPMHVSHTWLRARTTSRAVCRLHNRTTCCLAGRPPCVQSWQQHHKAAAKGVAGAGLAGGAVGASNNDEEEAAGDGEDPAASAVPVIESCSLAAAHAGADGYRHALACGCLLLQFTGTRLGCGAVAATYHPSCPRAPAWHGMRRPSRHAVRTAASFACSRFGWSCCVVIRARVHMRLHVPLLVQEPRQAKVPCSCVRGSRGFCCCWCKPNLGSSPSTACVCGQARVRWAHVRQALTGGL